MSKDQIPKRIPNNANHISSSIMVLQTNIMTLGKFVIKCPLKPRKNLEKSLEMPFPAFWRKILRNSEDYKMS